MWCDLASSVTIGNEQIVEVDMNQPMSFGVQREVQFRFLCPNDIDEVKRLCTEWFPIEYPDTWYQEITSNPKFYSLAATYHSRIIGIIVVEVKQLANTNKEDADILASYNSSTCQVAYILSLGVVVDYRKHGIDTLLLYDERLTFLKSDCTSMPGCRQYPRYCWIAWSHTSLPRTATTVRPSISMSWPQTVWPSSSTRGGDSRFTVSSPTTTRYKESPGMDTSMSCTLMAASPHGPLLIISWTWERF